MLLQHTADTTDQPAAPDRNEDGVDIRQLPGNFDPACPLAGHDRRIIVRRDVVEAFAFCVGSRLLLGVETVRTEEANLTAIASNRIDLGC